MPTPHLTASLRHVVQAATLAPSVHNTQPWRFVLHPTGFELRADRSRQLPVLDPTGRQLHVSCGAALATARIAARALGLDAEVELLPDREDRDLLARLTLSSGPPADDRELALALAVLRRHTVREAFAEQPLPSGLLAEMSATAEREGAALRPLVSDDEQVALAVLLSRADRHEEGDPGYREEIAAWVRPAESGDGIPVDALPTAAGRGSSLRLRDFTLTLPEHGDGTAPPAEHPVVVVLTTRGDGPRAWLQAGQALGAVLLQAAAVDVQAQPLGQVVDLPGPRAALARELGLTGSPQMVLRLGLAPARAATPRRDLDDVCVG